MNIRTVHPVLCSSLFEAITRIDLSLNRLATGSTLSTGADGADLSRAAHLGSEMAKSPANLELAAAYSEVADVDIASELSELRRSQIQFSASAVALETTNQMQRESLLSLLA